MRPLARAPALLHTPKDDLPWHLGTGFVNRCIDRYPRGLEYRRGPGHIVHGASTARSPQFAGESPTHSVGPGHLTHPQPPETYSTSAAPLSAPAAPAAPSGQ